MDKKLSDQLIKWAEKEVKTYPSLAMVNITYAKFNPEKYKWACHIWEEYDGKDLVKEGETPQEAYIKTLHAIMGTEEPPF